MRGPISFCQRAHAPSLRHPAPCTPPHHEWAQRALPTGPPCVRPCSLDLAFVLPPRSGSLSTHTGRGRVGRCAGLPGKVGEAQRDSTRSARSPLRGELVLRKLGQSFPASSSASVPPFFTPSLPCKKQDNGRSRSGGGAGLRRPFRAPRGPRGARELATRAGGPASAECGRELVCGCRCVSAYRHVRVYQCLSVSVRMCVYDACTCVSVCHCVLVRVCVNMCVC